MDRLLGGYGFDLTEPESPHCDASHWAGGKLRYMGTTTRLQARYSGGTRSVGLGVSIDPVRSQLLRRSSLCADAVDAGGGRRRNGRGDLNPLLDVERVVGGVKRERLVAPGLAKHLLVGDALGLRLRTIQAPQNRGEVVSLQERNKALGAQENGAEVLLEKGGTKRKAVSQENRVPTKRVKTTGTFYNFDVRTCAFCGLEHF
ncbi:hypothetical protein B0H15DRAFT_803281 [Mycena belliarum]|uniref:Uncharacterized protein n=1 Tax=Mycena belliarum TaxID=1033014 RepID=A0AAD6XNP7_9AGAR|nr:hypothetical protein B0H15DRAFT_803281 [Mycena belliae]